MTVNNTAILDNQLTASMFWWFRYEPSGSNLMNVINGTWTVGRNDGYGPFAALWATQQPPAGYVGIDCNFGIQGGGYSCSWLNYAIGVAWPIMMVFSQGHQTLYLPGQTISMGANTGPLVTGNYPFGIGGTPIGNPCVFTIGDVNVWNGYAATAADYNTLVLGGNPTTIGQSATARYRWTLAGTVGGTPTVGDPGLAEAYAGVYNLSAFSGNGSAVYTAPLSYQPTAQMSSPTHVGTSGQTVFFFFKAVTSGAPATPVAINTAPTLYQNGVNLGQLTSPFLDGSRPFIQYNVPAGVQLNPGDVVTVSAPSMWCTTTAGAVGSLTGMNVPNRSGMSAFATESLPKTLRMGMNFPHLGTTFYCLYRLQRNQRYNLLPFQQGATTAPDGTPLSFPGTWATALLEDYSLQNNLIDSTNYPGQTGLRAIGWNSPKSSTTSLALSSGNAATTVVTERTDLANPGDANGNGRVRVFNIQQATGSTTASLSVQVLWSGAAAPADFTDVKIYASGDVTAVSGQPVVLDETNPYALSAVTLDRFHTGLGVARFVDSTLGSGGWTNVVEPWQLRNLTDFTWGEGVYKTTLTVNYSQARPYSPSVSPYVYGPSWILPAG